MPDENGAAVSPVPGDPSSIAPVQLNASSVQIDQNSTNPGNGQTIITLPDGSLALVETPGSVSESVQQQPGTLTNTMPQVPSTAFGASTGNISLSAPGNLPTGSNVVFTDESGQTYVLDGTTLIPTSNLPGSGTAPAVAEKQQRLPQLIGTGVTYDDPDFRCTHCSYSADNLLYMNQHIVLRHPEAANPPGALTGTSKATSLKRCAFCNMAYKTLMKLKEHLEVKHAPNSIREKSLAPSKAGARQNDGDKLDPLECK